MSRIQLSLLAFVAACGTAAAEPRPATPAERAELAAIGRVNTAGLYRRSQCSGTLIEPDLVLTAAHCVIHPRTRGPVRVSDLRFVAGYHQGEYVDFAKARAFTMHPEYDPRVRPAPPLATVDLALIRLAEPLDVAPLPLGPAETGGASAPGYRGDRPHVLTMAEGCPLTALPEDPDHPLTLVCNVMQGNSGGPVIQNGALVGVLSMKGAGLVIAAPARLDEIPVP